MIEAVGAFLLMQVFAVVGIAYAWWWWRRQ